MRFKPPGSLDSKLGWQMELRSVDSPLTSREKAALIFLVKLFKNMIMDQKLGVYFYLPISLVDENFDQAVKRDSTSDDASANICMARIVLRTNEFK